METQNIATSTLRKKNYTFFIGTDISRDKLDHAVMQGNSLLFHQITANDEDAVAELIRELKAIKGFTVSRAIFCMENTGIYSNHMVSQLRKVKANIAIQPPMQIRNSMGNVRSKTDKIDAIRIAEFAYKCREELRFFIPDRPVIRQLAQLNTMRERMLATQTALRQPLKEAAGFVQKKQVLQATRLCHRSLEGVKADLLDIEAAIAGTWETDEKLKRLMQIIISVPCIGPVTALRILIVTNEFNSISNPKKFACYAGVAPFIRQSGTFTGKARVSHMADKKMKSLLHICALNASRYEPDLKAYYVRKTQDEGKNKMLALNNIRYKLILRIFACVVQDRLYEKNYERPTIQQVAASEALPSIIE
jgi:transposase